MDDNQLTAIFATIDAANADDPNLVDGHPLAQTQGRLAEAWVTRLDPHAGAALRIAARAHHLRRWAVPRSTYPEGRPGYLKWRRDQKTRHAAELAELLTSHQIDPAITERATVIVQKKGLGSDTEVQVFEDAVCLTFIETQFLSTADKLADDDKMVDVVAKTLRKMSPSGHASARRIELDERASAIVQRAIASLDETAS